ncbi:MAG: UDP-N-acetylmuramoyl-L-alanine--D-glutamate ligase [Bauldia sp.]
MIAATSFAGKTVAVFGLGKSGVAAAQALVAGGATVAAGDESAAAMEKARASGAPIADLAKADWGRFSALILAPGVPLTHPKPHWTVERARAAGVEVIGDVELFCRERRRLAPDSPFVAITGTNGKSTTTALIAHLLGSAGRDTALGGNIGTPILSLAPPASRRVHVIECSTFQIDLAPSLDPTVGVLLNLSEDHIDRHGTFARYAALKERLVVASREVVIGVDDENCRTILQRLPQPPNRIVPISCRDRLERGIFARSGRLYSAAGGEIARLEGVGSLRGEHNWQNAAAAAAAARFVGLSDAEIAAGLKTFAGLPHRMEEVGRRGAVLFINDSKATNADAAAKALASFDRIYWILGGRPKAGGIATLDRYFDRVAGAYLIGEATEEFAATLEGKVPYEKMGTLDAALTVAAEDAARDKNGERVVLLSPACASYDQFKNFEERGDCFRALVGQLDRAGRDGEAA